MSLTNFSSTDNKRFTVQASLSTPTGLLQLSALVDSGAEDNFIDQEMAEQAGFTTEPLETPIAVRALDGKLLARVTHQTPPLHLQVSGNH